MTQRRDSDEAMLDQAIAWQQALKHADADWDGYVAWLRADGRHREIFDQLELVERAIDERADDLGRLTLTASAGIPRPNRRRWLIGSLAAALVGAVAVPSLLFDARQDSVFVTGAGETRRVTLEDRVSVDLAPSTRLIVKHGRATDLQLASGEAFFTVAHDPGRTLRIEAADYTVSDIGTQFGIDMAPERVTVAVAEGYVSIGKRGGAKTRVAAGQQMVAGRNRRDMVILPVAQHAVGSWRHGRLVYSNAPLSVVAAGLSRHSGKAVEVDPAIRNLQFSGVLAIGKGSTVFDDLAGLTGVTYQEVGGRVRLSPHRDR